MSTIILRATKGTPLTITEVDANFNNLNTSKVETSDAVSTNTASKVVARDASGNFAANIISATDFNSTSDARLKENVTSLWNGLELVKQLTPVEFDWRDSGKHSYGLIAQQLENTFPELVIEREDGMKGVSYIPIIAMLIDAVNTLDARVKQLEK